MIYRDVVVGFCYDETSLESHLGRAHLSWGYCCSYGNIEDFWSGESYGPMYTCGDTIGCGVNFKTKTMFFTKNGSVLGKLFLLALFTLCAKPLWLPHQAQICCKSNKCRLGWIFEKLTQDQAMHLTALTSRANCIRLYL